MISTIVRLVPKQAALVCGLVATHFVAVQVHAHNVRNDAPLALEQAHVSGPTTNPGKKSPAELKAAKEKKKAERAAKREERLAAKRTGSKKAQEAAAPKPAGGKPSNDDVGGSDDPLEGL